MNKIQKRRAFIITPMILVIATCNLFSQSDRDLQPPLSQDSLSLKTIISEIIKNHPTVKSAEESLINADARIGLAKTGFYPVVDMVANFSNQGPVIKLTIPDMGTFSLFPQNSYSAAINYRQTIYDFGRTRQNLSIENENKVVGEKTLEQVKQKMALAAVNNFYTLAFLQEALRIKDEEIMTLQSHLKFVETMRATGSGTDYQILSTKVKISVVESQKVDLLASLTIQQTYLNSLAGYDEKNLPVVREELNIATHVIEQDSMLSFAFRNRDEIIISKEKANLAGLRYELIKSSNKPLISLMATGGAKNGFIPNLDQIRPNYAVGLGITVPLFDGMRTKYNLLQAESAIHSISYETENVKRSVTSEVKEAEAYMKSAGQKIKQSELQLEQALNAYSLAKTSFTSGVVTNLELLDADNVMSESRLMLLKARIDYAASIYRLKAALGERIY